MTGILWELHRRAATYHQNCPVARARRSIFRFIEGFCNPDRLHSVIGALSPVDYEDEYHSHDHSQSEERHSPVAA